MVELTGCLHFFYLITFGLRSIEITVIDEDSVIDFFHILQLQFAILELFTFTLDQEIFFDKFHFQFLNGLYIFFLGLSLLVKLEHHSATFKP